MKMSNLVYISAIITLWALIFLVFLPRACDKEFKNQDALNAQYASAEWVPQVGDSYYGKR